MKVEVWDNAGKYIDYMVMDAAPMVDDYISLTGSWYKVWRRFIINGNELHIQLAPRIAMNTSQMPKF